MKGKKIELGHRSEIKSLGRLAEEAPDCKADIAGWTFRLSGIAYEGAKPGNAHLAEPCTLVSATD